MAESNTNPTIPPLPDCAIAEIEDKKDRIQRKSAVLGKDVGFLNSIKSKLQRKGYPGNSKTIISFIS